MKLNEEKDEELRILGRLWERKTVREIKRRGDVYINE